MQFGQLKRREFITLLGGTAAWPLAARAQQPERTPVVGCLNSESRSAFGHRLEVFHRGLAESGYRWSAGDAARLRKDAGELVALGPEAILAGVGATTAALQQISR